MTPVLVLAALLLGPSALAQDRDGDGLSDFHEVHKYRTDPVSPDSDGDGVPDGDWLERREFTYVVRSVVQVMRPVTPAFLDDDFQDVRVLDEAPGWVELEVIHYPLSTAQDEIVADPDWRRHADDPAFAEWLAPGPTSDWDEDLRDTLVAALAEDGNDVDALDDVALVEQVSAWLLRRAQSIDCFTAFSAAFDDTGRPFVPEELRAKVNGGRPPSAEDWERELSAAGMFHRRTRGSCSSSSIYLSGCLKALGIPTRTVLCIPIIDAGDPREWALVRENVAQPHVRRTILAGMAGLERSWSSHTFNEVFVGGRWRRLDYTELGAGILRASRFGLMTHVATFADWADARMPETIGRRQALQLRDAVLDGANPYSTIALRDAVGPHCSHALPEAEELVARLEAVVWTDDPDLPENVRANIQRTGRFGLLARVTEVDSGGELRELLAVADLRVDLEAEGHPTLEVALDPQCWWYRGDHALVYLPFGSAVRQDLAEGVEYGVQPRNESREAHIEASQGLAIRRAP